jgi:hypothetical protein
MLPALAGATASLCVFCIMLFAKFPPWGARKKKRKKKEEAMGKKSRALVKAPPVLPAEKAMTPAPTPGIIESGLTDI